MSTAFGQNEPRRFALYVNLNPNDCLTCMGSLQTILKSTAGKLPIVLVVPEAYSRQEINNLASVILGDTLWLKHIRSDNALYQKLNAGGPTALHLLNPEKEKIRSFSTLNPAQAAAEINDLSGFQRKPVVKTYDVLNRFPAVGASQITHHGSATAVLNQAINRFSYLSWAADSASSARSYDTSHFAIEQSYRMWFSDTTGFSVYSDLHKKLIKTLNFSATRFESLYFSDSLNLSLLYAWYTPKPIRFEGKKSELWSPVHFWVQINADTMEILPVREIKKNQYPAGPFIKQNNRYRMVIEGDTLLARSKYLLEFEYNSKSGKLKRKAIPHLPEIPQAVVDSGWNPIWHKHFLIFASISWVFDMNQIKWKKFALPEGMQNLLTLRKTHFGYEGIVKDIDKNLYLFLWNADGLPFDHWPLNETPADVKSNFSADRNTLRWVDAQQKLKVLHIR